MKKFIKLLACVLAISLLTAFVINVSNFALLKKLTQKKVVNPDNIFVSDTVKWNKYISKNGINFDCQEDGTWHIYGTSTVSGAIVLTLESFTLEAGKTYTFSQGLERAGSLSYFVKLECSNGNTYLGDLDPVIDADDSRQIYGSFVAQSGATYTVGIYIRNTGAVIDETFCPVLVEGTEAGEFYIYK